MIYWAEPFELSEEDTKYLRDTYKTPEFRRENGYYYTGYHHAAGSARRTSKSAGSWIDKRLIDIYTPVLKSILTEHGLFSCDRKAIYSFQHIWAQIYTKEFGRGIGAHHHYPSHQNLISWIHFVDVPKEDCLYFEFESGKKIYPQPQRSGNLVFFPPWVMHGVEPVVSQEDRVVVAGNVLRLK